MVCRVGERYAVLIKVIAHRNLATESITATIEIYLVVLVVTGLHQHWHVQFGA